MRYQLVTAPTVTPISTSEAKAYMRVIGSSEDSLIESLIKAATVWCEAYTKRAFITQTIRVRVRRIVEREFQWPVSPLQSITGIAYYDEDNQPQIVDPGTYEVCTDGIYPFIYFKTLPPTPGPRSDAYGLTGVCGYGLAVNVPEDVKTAIKFMVSYLYENRQVLQAPLLEAPRAAQSLLNRIKAL